MNNVSNQENWSKSKKWNDFSSITLAIWVHQPAGKAAAVQAKVTDEKFVKSFDCFATSFRSFHFVSFVQVSASELKEELEGFFQDKHKWKYRIDRDFKWIYRMCVGNWHVTAMNKKCESLKVVKWMKKFINYQVN